MIGVPTPIPWKEISLESIARFLDQADEEGVTWEAKADDDQGAAAAQGREPGKLTTRTIRRAVCGLANQMGGLIILGARGGRGKPWTVCGFTPREPEVKSWLERLIRDGLQPSPRIEVCTWSIEGGTVAAILVAPVAEPPCMTSDGNIYERVSGDTVRVGDPLQLARLSERGSRARTTAEARSGRIGDRVAHAIAGDVPAVSAVMSLSPIGRVSDDMASLLFRPDLHDRMRFAVAELACRAQPMSVTPRGMHTQSSMVVEAQDDSTSWWRVEADWTGSVAIGVGLKVAALGSFSIIESVVTAGWAATGRTVAELGGFGPACLTLRVERAVNEAGIGDPDSTLHHWVTPWSPGAPVPSPASFFGGLPPIVKIRRWPSVDAELDDAIVASIHRELGRAAGQTMYETSP